MWFNFLFHKYRENREWERKNKREKIKKDFNQYGKIKRQLDREGGRVKERIEK